MRTGFQEKKHTDGELLELLRYLSAKGVAYIMNKALAAGKMLFVILCFSTATPVALLIFFLGVSGYKRLKLHTHAKDIPEEARRF